MPRVIYCIHALSSHLFKLGKAPLIQDVFGTAIFTGKKKLSNTNSFSFVSEIFQNLLFLNSNFR